MLQHQERPHSLFVYDRALQSGGPPTYQLFSSSLIKLHTPVGPLHQYALILHMTDSMTLHSSSFCVLEVLLMDALHKCL